MTMIRVNIAEAKAQLSRLIARLRRGEVVVICNRNEPVAELRGLPRKRTGKRRLGTAKGLIEIPPSFFDDEWIADLFEGKDTGGADPL
jgi:prevent-host-death family protein